MMRVLAGDQAALELWSKTRAWVISGQRKTLSRLGVPFDKVIFESDFLPEVAELTNLGLREGTLRRREDGMVFYPTAREELEEMPLVRSDGLPTQHMRALAYWSAAPELDDFTSLQVCGTEWVSHVTCRRQLLDVLATAKSNGHPNPVVNGNGRGGPPTHDVFHGMVARQKRSGQLLEGGGAPDRRPGRVGWTGASPPTRRWRRCGRRTRSPNGSRRGSSSPTSSCRRPRSGSSSSPELLFEPERSLGWDVVAAQAHRSACGRGGRRRGGATSAGADDPDYRFAVVQSELFRRHLRSAVVDLDPVPLARYLSHFARWYAAEERSPRVEGSPRRCSTRASAGSGWRRRDAHPAGRQPRLLHLQRLPPAGGGLG